MDPTPGSSITVPAAPRMDLTALAVEQETAAHRRDFARAMPVICIAEAVQIVNGRQNNARHTARTVGALDSNCLASAR